MNSANDNKLREALMKHMQSDDRVGLVVVFRHTPNVARYIIRKPEYERLKRAMIYEHQIIVLPLSDGAEIVLRLVDVLVIQQEVPNDRQ